MKIILFYKLLNLFKNSNVISLFLSEQIIDTIPSLYRALGRNIYVTIFFKVSQSPSFCNAMSTNILNINFKMFPLTSHSLQIRIKFDIYKIKQPFSFIIIKLIQKIQML